MNFNGLTITEWGNRRWYGDLVADDSSGVVSSSISNVQGHFGEGSYASGYKYALIFVYSNQNMTDQTYLQPLTITWVGNMSSTTSYNTKTITKNGPNKLTFTVTKGNIILNNSGSEYYQYLIIWSN